MRLISDEDLKDRASEYCLSEDEFRRFCKIIDAEPTACDVDKLIKHLNDYALQEAPNDNESMGERENQKVVYDTIQNCIKCIEETVTAYDKGKI